MDGGAMNRRTMMTTLAGGVVAVGYAGRAKAATCKTFTNNSANWCNLAGSLRKFRLFC